MRSPDELRQAIKASECPVSQIAERAGIASTTLYSFVSGATGSLRASTHAAVEAVLTDEVVGVAEERTRFKGPGQDIHPALLEEGERLGIDVEETARKAVEDAVKRARIDAWIEENREAFAANARDVEENGLWCDRYRMF